MPYFLSGIKRTIYPHTHAHAYTSRIVSQGKNVSVNSVDYYMMMVWVSGNIKLRNRVLKTVMGRRKNGTRLEGECN